MDKIDDRRDSFSTSGSIGERFGGSLEAWELRDVLMAMLQVRRGVVLTDAVVRERANNIAMVVANRFDIRRRA